MEGHRKNWVCKSTLILSATFGLAAPLMAADDVKIRDPLEITSNAGARFESNAENESGGRPGVILDGSLALDQKIKLQDNEYLIFGASFNYEQFFYEESEFENEEDEDDGSQYVIKTAHDKKYRYVDVVLTGKFVDSYEELFKNKDDRSYRIELELQDKESKKYRRKLFMQQRFDKFFDAQRTKLDLSLTRTSKYDPWSIKTKPFAFHEWFYSASPRRRDLGAGLGVTFSRKLNNNFTLNIEPKFQAVHSTDDDRSYAEAILPVTLEWGKEIFPLWKWRLTPEK